MEVFLMEFAEKLPFFLQSLRYGFNAGCLLSRIQPAFHTPEVRFRKLQKIVIF